jgi:O-antigen/teichoic acid export membrane protein
MSQEGKKKPKLTRHQKGLAKNSLYALLSSYSNYIYALITSLLIADMIIDAIWDFLVLATAIIAVIVTISSFIPPGLNSSLNYYIPRYKSMHKMKELRSFLFRCFSIKTLVISLSFLGFMLIFLIFPSIFTLTLENYISLLFILSPIIITLGFERFLLGVLQGFGYFKLIFFLNILKALINIVGLALLLFFVTNITVDMIAMVNMLSLMIPFILHFIICLKIIFGLEKSSEEKISWKKFTKKILSYGSFIGLMSVIQSVWNEFKKISIGIFSTVEGLVIGFTISKRYSEVASLSTSGLSNPLVVSFSELDSKQEYIQMRKIYNLTLKYMLFSLSFVTGGLFFFSEFFLFFIYGESYIIYSLILKLMLINVIIDPLSNIFYSVLRAKKKVVQFLILNSVLLSIKVILFILGLIIFDFYLAVIMLIISNFISFISLSILNYKLLKIELELKKLITQFFIFFLSLGLTIILNSLILENWNIFIIQSLNLNYFRYFNIFSILCFFILFLFFNFVFRIINKSDLFYINSLFHKEKFSHKMIRKIANKLKIFMRD